MGPELPLSKTWARMIVIGIVGFVVYRYLSWRFFITVLPAKGSPLELTWIWFCFGVELLALADAVVLYLTFLRTTDRRSEADEKERRLRATSMLSAPSVDVYIPTYNEPFDVLEKTITAALFLDYPNFKVWVLDDGRRAWLKDFCESKGVGYVTRTDNDHAKAGNINHALTKTSADFVVLFDADFAVQRNFLMRTMGFFVDPKIGIVQVPHAFYNHDPLQTNLALRTALPDDQRFFFEAIMPSRDGWDAAFCCGSNSVTRRDALRTIGDALPTQSITEDMLLTLMLLRKGYTTRYLCERLAYGLAPEGLQAFFVQRRRWARGAVQILYLKDGPLGPGLRMVHRLLFLPTHWLSQGLSYAVAAVVPIVLLWTGTMPMENVTLEGVISYLLPMLLAIVGGTWVFAPKQYVPLAVQILGTFSSIKLLPTILATFVKPFGHAFKVTPKGAAARSSFYDAKVFWTSAILILVTAGGIVINVIPEWRIIPSSSLLPIVAAWATYNIVIFFIVCMLSIQGAVRRGEERFKYDEEVLILGPGEKRTLSKLNDLSLTGAGIHCDREDIFSGMIGRQVQVLISEVGFISASIARVKGTHLGLAFSIPQSVERDGLIRKLFTSGSVATVHTSSAWSATSALLRSIWAAPSAEWTTTRENMGTTRSTNEPKLPAISLVVAPRSSANVRPSAERRSAAR